MGVATVVGQLVDGRVLRHTLQLLLSIGPAHTSMSGIHKQFQDGQEAQEGAEPTDDDSAYL